MIKTLYKKFQSWPEKGSVYIISDTHFLDLDMNWRWSLIKDYPYAVLDILDEEYIAKCISKYIVYKINKVVHKNDCLVVLGDIGDVSYIKRLKAGHKILIKGNHDSGTSNYEDYFDEVYEGPLFISEKILLSHEPILGHWLSIHGHVHDTEYKDSDKEITLCCEKIGFTPINLGEIIKSGKLKNIDSIHRDTINKATARKNS